MMLARLFDKVGLFLLNYQNYSPSELFYFELGTTSNKSTQFVQLAPIWVRLKIFRQLRNKLLESL